MTLAALKRIPMAPVLAVRLRWITYRFRQFQSKHRKMGEYVTRLEEQSKQLNDRLAKLKDTDAEAVLKEKANRLEQKLKEARTERGALEPSLKEYAESAFKIVCRTFTYRNLYAIRHFSGTVNKKYSAKIADISNIIFPIGGIAAAVLAAIAGYRNWVAGGLIVTVLGVLCQAWWRAAKMISGIILKRTDTMLKIEELVIKKRDEKKD